MQAEGGQAVVGNEFAEEGTETDPDRKLFVIAKNNGEVPVVVREYE